MKKPTLILICLALLLPLFSCAVSRGQADGSIGYYTDIPDITLEEISAIEALKSERASFSYGAHFGTELFIKPDGSYAGFTVKLTGLLTELFGIEFKHKLLYSWELLENLYNDKTIDFIGELTSSPERAQRHYMTSPIAEHALRVFTRTDAPILTQESDLNGLTVGFLEGTITASYILEAYPSLSFKIADIINYADAAEKLRSGEIDVFVQESDADILFLDYPDIRSAMFFPLVHSPVSMSTMNSELAPVISAMSKYLTSGGIDTLLSLYSDGELEYARYKFAHTLTDEERDFLQSTSETPIKLALENDNYPVSFYNESEKAYQGMAVDILNEVRKIADFNYEIVTNKDMTWGETLVMLKTGQADILSQLLYTDERSEHFIWSETPYSISHYTLLSRIDYPDLSNQQVLRTKVGTLASTAYESVFYDWFPEHTKTKSYINQNDAVAALEKGEIDLLMASEFILRGQSNYFENSGLKINIVLGTPMHLRFAFNKDGRVLSSLINKAQSYVDTDAIERAWTNRNFDYQKKAAMERMYYLMFFVFALLLLLIMTLTLFIRNKRLSESLSRAVQRRTLELDRQTAALATVCNSIPDIVFSLDTDFRYTSCNPSFEKFAGLPASEILGKTVPEVLKDRAANMSLSSAEYRALKRGQPKVLEESVLYPDGTPEILETIITPTFENGIFTGLLWISRNITERRAADERMKLMLEATPLCCSLLDETGRVIDCNEEVVKLYELKDKSEYIEMFQCLSPERQPGGRLSSELSDEYISRAIKEGRIVFNWVHRKKDGTLVPTEVTLVRVKRDDEIVLAGYTRDLRESMKMLREIAHKDHLLQTVNTAASILLKSEIDEFDADLWECMGMLAKSADADRVYIWKNHTRNGILYCSQIHEWSEGAEAQQGKDITLEVSYEDIAPGWADKLSSGKCINGIVNDMPPEVQAVLSQQGILSVLIVPVFMRDEFWGFVGFDDCRRERLFSEDEESVLRSGSLLIAYALLRNQMTLDIQAAVEAAQAASRAKSNFLSNMSHEIRTPLNAITGMTTIGKTSPDISKKDYAFNKIENASIHLLGVINDILDMSKIEANRFQLSEIEFNFEKMLQRVVNVVSFRIDEKKQHFQVFLDGALPQTIIGDDQRLSQVITNLLSNAVKFTPEHGSIRLDADLAGVENGVYTIRIAITDTGIGINPERLPYLFEAFEQAENDTSRKYGGTGLGLSISKHIVNLMGGNIAVESELKRGSKFYFDIRVRAGTDKYQNPLDSQFDWSDIRVLAVDDDPCVREYFENIAAQLNINCDTASSGEEALKIIDEKGFYDINFIDWKMPGMSGLELSREIKMRVPDKSVIVIMSAYELMKIEKEARAAGADQLMPKPFFPSSVADCINECLGKHSVAEPSEEPEKAVSFEGLRMLLAEDVDINRDIVITLLEPTKIEIDCAENGLEALNMFEKDPERYDLIFMDMQMPEMDGLTATRRIRALGFPKAEEIPIIAMTANVFREDIEECKKAGMNEHMGKPLDVNEMLNKMKNCLALNG